MNEENGKSNAKKITIMAAIVVAVSGLLAWSLISLYKTPSYSPEEELLGEEELGVEEEIAAPEALTPPTAQETTETPITKEEAPKK